MTAPALSDRQMDVLRLRAAGHTGPEIATTLHLAVSTVAYHERVVLHALRARTWPHAIHLAHGLRLLAREQHGDHAGAVAHWRRGEPLCPACAAGETAHRAARRTAALPATTPRSRPDDHPAGRHPARRRRVRP